ncbi:MAG: NAD-dependent epimerase/dehydratase family protein [Bryobacteraceae bacterium]|nr:NAD-dependent epimerase/dehydratase family protein [Bryobacteraceae bacterium]
MPCPRTEAELEELLSTPSEAEREALSKLRGTLMLLGAGGKMGPSLARLAKRAAPHLRVVAVARFSEAHLRPELERDGVETIAGDLLARGAFDSLPDADNVIYLAARKFGTAGDASPTWATNTVLPGLVAQRYAGSRIISWSTGNVYPFVAVDGGGATEDTPLAPVGEYGQSALGRERVFEYYSRAQGTPVVMLRLNYAVDLRYGVLVDLARQLLAGEPIPLEMGHVNVIWQGDANSICLRAFDLCASPPAALNVTGAEVLSVREAAEALAARLGVTARFTGTPAGTALLSNSGLSQRLFGPPRVSSSELIDWVAQWVTQGGRLLTKPTHFAVRDGKF